MADSSENAPQSSNLDVGGEPRYLSFDGALQEIRRLGFTITTSQLRTWIWNKSLPFFHMGKRLYIDRTDLQMHFRALQTKANKELRERGASNQKKVSRR